MRTAAGRVIAVVPHGELRAALIGALAREQDAAAGTEFVHDIVEAVISPTGCVSSARVLRSIPLLDSPAVAAVSGWLFTPTVLDGSPVPVIMTVTVNFTLQ